MESIAINTVRVATQPLLAAIFDATLWLLLVNGSFVPHLCAFIFHD